MATYKVLQDIEAEDKFVGPLTLKQFIFAGIAAICLYLSVFTLTRGIWIISVIFLPVIIFFGFLAWPFMRDQPTEIWLLAKVRFFFKPRRRIWDQSGQSDLVTITAPKKAERPAGMDLTQIEVKSRLKSLAQTIDSRGWAVKNVNVNLFAEPTYLSGGSDRLIDPSALPQEVPQADVMPADDIMDPRSNPVAQHLDEMMNAAAHARRQAAVDMIKSGGKTPADKDAPAADFGWFMNLPDRQAGAPGKEQMPSPDLTAFGTQTAPPKTADNVPTAEELAVLERVKAEQSHPAPSYGRTKVIHTLAEQKATLRQAQGKKSKKQKAAATQKRKQSSSAITPDPAILRLAADDDKNVDTIAREARRELGPNAGDEVVIPLR